MRGSSKLKSEAYTRVSQAINSNRGGVIMAVKESFVDVPLNISDADLYDLIVNELVHKRNGYLVYHLGTLINKIDNTSSNIESKSNFDFHQLFPIGNMLGLFGKKKEQGSAPSQADPMMLQMQMAQQQAREQAERQRREAQERRDEADRRRRTNMMIFGGIGGVIVIGLGVWAIMRAKNK
ncbi:MAG: hypothetical protein ACW98D_16690 [Promethearchaeota archaeon]|jgi:hypothetical protein